MTSAVGVTQSVGYPDIDSGDNFLPITVTDGVGYMGGYSFDSKGSVMTRMDGNQKATIFTYDAFGNKTSETDPLLNTTSYQYDNMGRMTAMTDTLGVVSNYEYDALGFMKVMTAAVGTTSLITTSYTYDASRNKIKETDSLGRVTNYQYDNLNRLTLITYTNSPYYSGNITQSFTYDFRGNKLTETDMDGHQTKYSYTLAGQLITTTLASTSPTDAITMTVAYDAAGRKTREYNAYSNSATLPGTTPYIQYEYDAADQLKTITNQMSITTTFVYDNAGRKINQSDNRKLVTYTYNTRNQLITTTYPTIGGIPISNSQNYDPAGRLASQTDANGKTTNYLYDEAGRLKQVIMPLSAGVSSQTTYQYDLVGRLLAMTDGNGHTTSFGYDVLGRQTTKTLPDNSFEQYVYDRVGNRTSVRLADGITNTYQYDPLNRLRQLTYGTDGQTVIYSYTRSGLKQQVVDSRGTTKYQYDNLNRMVLITQPTSLSVAYQWDASSNRISMTTSTGGTNNTTRYAYDNANRLTIVTDTLGAGNSYTYDTSGLRSGLSLNNGASAINITYGYDALSRLTNITQTLPSSSPITYSYTLDAVGNKTRVNESSGISNTWQYDDSNRLLTETRKLGATITTTNYTYDKTGNRLQQTVNGSPVMTGTYNELDQLISDGTKQYTYDRRGNLTQITGGTKYKWDGADRLISATVGANTALYTYDDAGHRVKQTQGMTTTNFLWDEMSPYGDVVYESDGTTSTNYTLGKGALISQKRSSSTTEYFLMDGHSGVRSLASTTGNVLQNYNYDAFGNLQNFSGTPNTKYLYTGQQFDSLTNLYDLRARYYNPGQGRFISRDSADVSFNNPIELNRYIYTANNSVNAIDPSGKNFAEYSGGIDLGQGKNKELPLALRWLGNLSLKQIAALGVISALVIAEAVETVSPCEKQTSWFGLISRKLCLGLGLADSYVNFFNDPTITVYDDIWKPKPASGLGEKQLSTYDFVPKMLILMFVARKIIFDMTGFDLSRATSSAESLETLDLEQGWNIKPSPLPGDGNYTTWEFCTILENPSFLKKTDFINGTTTSLPKNLCGRGWGS